MTFKKHGLSVGVERVDQDFFLSMQIIGKLTHEDYNTITPMIDAALGQVKDPKVNAFIDVTELEGWELRAAWDDFKIGLKHNNEFHKIAIYGNKKWLEYAAKVGTWFVSGDVKYFEDPEEAMKWLRL